MFEQVSIVNINTRIDIKVGRQIFFSLKHDSSYTTLPFQPAWLGVPDTVSLKL